MVASGMALPRRSSQRRLVLTLAALAALCVWFIARSALRYLQYDANTYGDFWPRRYGLLVHITGGLIAISVGLAQIWLGLTGRTRQAHRVLGRLYGTGILLGSIGAYYLALTIDPKYAAYAAGLFMLSTAWIITTSMALLAIRRRAYAQHRDWMIRSYTVTFAFVIFRLLEPWLKQLHFASPDDVDAMLAWGCWSVPLLLTEPLIQLRSIRAS